LSRKEEIKAVGLISGGLDSTLAAILLKKQGIEVHGVSFDTGFSILEHRRNVQRKKDQSPERLRDEAKIASHQADIPIEIIDISREFLSVVLNPKHGYGATINPCIDCRIFMLKKAKEYADKIGARFIFTGEVIGQRPMSQYRSALSLIEKQSGLEGLLLRPLTAKHLDPTIAEKEGWVDREKLLDFHGRSRKRQLELCKDFGIEDIPQPSGGCCYLIDKNYARRFRDLVSHREKGMVTLDDMTLLKVGRHFRISYKVKAVVGRDEQENNFLEKFKKGRWCFQAVDCGSPVTLAEGEPDENEKRIMASLTARHSSARDQDEVKVLCEKDGSKEYLAINKSERKDFSEYRL
jgi:tRNA U34 2-thiouridine synthase MnmA/TrmU